MRRFKTKLTKEQESKLAWSEYDYAANWCALRNIEGKEGDPLPANISSRCLALINEDIEAFQKRVNLFAYAIAMKDIPEGDTL